jgi:hypothetical protein
MSDQQTEIPVDAVPVKARAEGISKTPEQTQKNDENPYQFTVLASLPWKFFDPMCCTKFSAEVWQTLDDDTYVTFHHAGDCDVWRYV